MTKPRTGQNQRQSNNKVGRIVIDGIPIELTYKKVLHGRLSVDQKGCVRLVVPYKVKPNRLEEFLLSKLDWLKSHLKRISLSIPLERRFKADEFVTLFGSRYPCAISEGNSNSIFFGNEAVEMCFKPNLPQASKLKLLRDFYKTTLHPVIEQRLEFWEQKTGLKCAEWKIRLMKSCWGSCYPERQLLQFNLRLVKKPLYCIDYIIVHELAHMVSRLHDDKFKEFLSLHLPSWKQIRKKLTDTYSDYED